jgi:hypothetical protein
MFTEFVAEKDTHHHLRVDHVPHRLLATREYVQTATVWMITPYYLATRLFTSFLLVATTTSRPNTRPPPF